MAKTNVQTACDTPWAHLQWLFNGFKLYKNNYMEGSGSATIK